MNDYICFITNCFWFIEVYTNIIAGLEEFAHSIALVAIRVNEAFEKPLKIEMVAF